MLIGTTSVGKVLRFEKQAVETRFVFLGGPLFPLSSRFIVDASAGVEIEMNGMSVTAAYLRWYLAAAAVGLTFSGNYWIGGACVVGWVYSVWFLGRLPASKREEAAFRHAACGISLDPVLLREPLRCEVLTALQNALEVNHLPLRAPDWRDRAPEAAQVFLLFTFASYNIAQGIDPEAWAEVRAKTLERVQPQPRGPTVQPS
jgi:hypothetical protein